MHEKSNNKRVYQIRTSEKHLGTNLETHKKWIKSPFTPDMDWLNIEIDLVRTISSFDLPKYKESKETILGMNN